ncbi:MAG: sugar ABC transporter permease [Clostridiales bacterium]|jgi:putative aldouronate transport system permease protein|nr:sugar ABC transporter permease [Clostridiales bacterium]
MVAKGEVRMRLVDIKKDWKKNKVIYFLALPTVIYFIIWHYIPMAGVVLAFEDYSPRGGVTGSEWIGIANFINFFSTYYFGRLMRNTIILSVFSMVINFPAPIILALLLNEMENRYFKKVVQTISYMPYFVSTVVICGIIVDFFSYDGALTDILVNMGVVERRDLMVYKPMFRPIFVFSGTWQGVGYGSIIYLAALSGVDQELYEAAKIDGAGRWKQTIHITLPGIKPTIIIMLILQIGSLLNVAMEKVLLLYKPQTYEVADVIMTFVYRRGLLENDYGYSTAVQIFNSVINLLLLMTANAISRKYSETSLF